MSRITMFAAIATIAFAPVSYAQQARIETPMSTGAGGFTLTISTPLADGPFDTAMNKGPKINTIQGNTYGEVLFKAGTDLSTTSQVIFMATVYRDDKANERGKPYSAEAIAQDLIKHQGYVGRAVPFNCPKPPFEGSTVVCYKMSGSPIFEGKTVSRSAVTLAAVSFKNNTQGYALIGKAIDSNAQEFDKNIAAYEKSSNQAVGSMWKNSDFHGN